MLLMASTTSKKVRMFYMYKSMNNLSIAKIYFTFVVALFMYTCFPKKVEHRKEKKDASMGDEYSHNFTN